MKFGVISSLYNDKESNLGDDIQAIAAGRFLPSVDIYLDREKLNSYTDKIFTIINGWYIHNTDAFPPSRSITPIIITSFHISPMVVEKMMNKRTISYLKEHQPIGCRDFYTKDLLTTHGIESYFSACLTLTLNRDDFSNSRTDRKEILLSDVFFRVTPKGGRKERLKHLIYSKVSRKRLIKKLLPPEIEKKAVTISHFLGCAPVSFEKRFDLAEQLLRRYANAKLVITSRLHAALPCLALGTPVLFVVENENDARFSGLSDLLNIVTVDRVKSMRKRGQIKIKKKAIDWDNIANTNDFVEYSDRLKKEIKAACQNAGLE